MSHVFMEMSHSAEHLAKYFEGRKDFYARWVLTITFLTVALSLAVTISSILGKDTRIPACIGALLTAVLSLESSFTFRDKLARYKAFEAEAENLLWDLQEDDSDAKRIEVRKRLQELRMRAAAPGKKSDNDNPDL